MSTSTTRLAMMASYLFPATACGIPGDPTGRAGPDTGMIRSSGMIWQVCAQPSSQPARLSPMHLMIQGIRPIPTCPARLLPGHAGINQTAPDILVALTGRTVQVVGTDGGHYASEPADVPVHRRRRARADKGRAATAERQAADRR